MTSPFSNPAAGATAAASGYTAALLSLLGDRDPLDVLAELVPWMERRLEGAREGLLERPEAPGKWSALDLLRHLVDTEIVHAYRVRSALELDGAPIRGYDQDAWVRLFAVSVPTAADGLVLLRALRTANLRLWRSLDTAALERAVRHEERGRETVAHMLRLLGGHDLAHRRQMDRILG